MAMDGSVVVWWRQAPHYMWRECFEYIIETRITISMPLSLETLSQHSLSIIYLQRLYEFIVRKSFIGVYAFPFCKWYDDDTPNEQPPFV